MQSAFPSVYSDAEAGIQSRFAAGEINEAGKGLKTDMLNEFAAALASLHSEANK